MHWIMGNRKSTTKAYSSFVMKNKLLQFTNMQPTIGVWCYLKPGKYVYRKCAAPKKTITRPWFHFFAQNTTYKLTRFINTSYNIQSEIMHDRK